MDKKDIEKNFADRAMCDFFDIIVADETESTNTWLKTLAKDGAKEGKVIIAEKQTKGRGRQGRSFFSPENTGLYMSVLFYPSMSPDITVKITAAAAVAVSCAIEKVSDKRAEIKWVNDIYLRGRKVCGILSESAYSGEKMGFVVIGIGVNVIKPKEGFPVDIANKAGYLFENDENGEKRALLATKILEELLVQYKNLENNHFLEEYKNRSCVVGREIYVIKNNIRKKAKAVSINNDCSLRVRYEEGETEDLKAGEISTEI